MEREYSIIELQGTAEVLEMMKDAHPEYNEELNTALDAVERMAST